MRNFFKFLFCLAALYPFIAQADDCKCSDYCKSEKYITVWGGGNHAFNHRPNLDMGWYVGGAVGMKLNDEWRADLSFDYIHNKAKGRGGHVNKSAVLLNGYYDFCNFECFPCLKPYVGAGIGYAYIDSKIFTEHTFAFQLGTGVNYKINDCWSASLSYRLLGTTNDGTGYHNLFGIGLSRHF